MRYKVTRASNEKLKPLVKNRGYLPTVALIVHSLRRRGGGEAFSRNIVNQLQVPTVGTKVGTTCLLPITRTVCEASSLVL